MSAGGLLLLAAVLAATGAWMLGASPGLRRLRRLMGHSRLRTRERTGGGRGYADSGDLRARAADAAGGSRPRPADALRPSSALGTADASGKGALGKGVCGKGRPGRDPAGADAAGGSTPGKASAVGSAAGGTGQAAPSADAAGSPDALAFDLDLVAICLLAGLPADRALEHAAQASADRSGLALVARALRLGTEEVRGLRPELETVETLIRFSGRTGVALAPLLGAHAAELRASEHRRRQIAAARLGVMLVLPLGVCVLPAFILLGVVPVLLTLVGDLLPALSGAPAGL